MRLVIIGGQPALSERLRDWHRAVGETVRLVNTYGPTEVSVVATMCDVTNGTRHALSTQYIPIGKAVGHIETFVLDKHLQVVPVGVPGELYIGGGGLARGYLGRPEQTAAAFIPHPFSTVSGSRLYKTGDRVRYRHDGDIEYLCRTDHQVKIRGVRVELNEIEVILSQHPSVQETVVVAQEDSSGEKWLAAYVVPTPDQTLDHNTLRQFLKTKLPDIMCPSAFITLCALPMTPSKKVDRRALPQPSRRQSASQPPFEPPRTPVESDIANVWAEVLDIQEIGINDNFFTTGGHSLLAMQVISRLQRVLPVSVSIHTFFKTPTIAGLSAWIVANWMDNPNDLERLLAEIER